MLAGFTSRSKEKGTVSVPSAAACPACLRAFRGIGWRDGWARILAEFTSLSDSRRRCGTGVGRERVVKSPRVKAVVTDLASAPQQNRDPLAPPRLELRVVVHVHFPELQAAGRRQRLHRPAHGA